MSTESNSMKSSYPAGVTLGRQRGEVPICPGACHAYLSVYLKAWTEIPSVNENSRDSDTRRSHTEKQQKVKYQGIPPVKLAS